MIKPGKKATFSEAGERNDFYTYKLSYPESMGGAVFYVGKGTDDRIKRHEYKTKRGISCPSSEHILKIWAAGEEVVREKIHTGMSEAQALQDEEMQIAYYEQYFELANVFTGGKAGIKKRKVA